jgi:Ca2+-binding RTX toxin-like protein
MALLRPVLLLALLAIVGLAAAAPGAPAQASSPPSCEEGPVKVGASIIGTPCNDTIVAPASVETVRGGGGDDTIVPKPIAAGAPCTGECRHLGVGSQTFDGGPGNDVIFGDRGNDTLDGGEGEDSLYGGIGDDELHGGSGDDLLSGGFGADSIDGEAGDDFVRGDATLDDIVDSGGDAGDTLSYATGVTPGFSNGNVEAAFPDFTSEYPGLPTHNGERGVYLNLEVDRGSIADDGVAPDGGGVDGGDEHHEDLQAGDFETFVGTPFSDFVVGSGDAETFYGGGGADVILGGGGGDAIFGGADGDHCAEASAEASCENVGSGVVTRDQGKVSVGVIAPEAGSNPGLYLTGSSGNDSVAATYSPGAKSVTFALSAGTFDPESSAVGSCDLPEAGKAVCELSEAPDSLLIAGMGGNDSLSTAGFPDTTTVVELGGAGEDSLTGADESEDVLADGPGDDNLDGRGDDDALLNNEGEDAVDGGTGSDLFLSNSICDGDTIDGGEGGYGDNASWTKLDEPVAARIDTGQVGEPVAGQPACPGGGQPDHLQSIEDLEGSRFGDFFYGDGASNQLLGRFGADTYFALGGEDTVLANSADSDLVVDCGGNPGDTAFIDLPTPSYSDPTPVGCETVYEAPPNSFRPPEVPTGPPLPPAPPKATKKTLPDRTAPRTRLLRRPTRVIYAMRRRRTVAFGFASNEAGTFRCKLDRGPFKPCRSPRRYRLAPGTHSFRVFAIDAAGNRDRSPALFSFRIRRR